MKKNGSSWLNLACFGATMPLYALYLCRNDCIIDFCLCFFCFSSLGAVILIRGAAVLFAYMQFFKITMLINAAEFVCEKIAKSKNILLYLLVCFVLYSFWTIVTPWNGAPDEFMRWDLVQWMVEGRGLPRVYTPELRDYNWGFSYAGTPFTTQIIGAFFYRTARFFFSPSPTILLYVARLPSILSSVGAVFFVYKTGRFLFHEKYAWLLTVMVSMWPQFAFVSSYVNNDAFALFTISLIVYGWIYGIKNNFCWKSCIVLAIGTGLCFLSYYNAFGFILLSVPVCVVAVLSKQENRERKKIILFIKKALCMITIVFAIASWFYIRNAYLYDGDFFGLRTADELSRRYAVDWLHPDNRSTFLNQGRSVFDMLRKTQWIQLSYRTFIAGFGWLNIFPHESVYVLYTAVMAMGVFGALFCFLLWIYRTKLKAGIDVFYLFLFFTIPIVISLSAYFSFSVGFQPQGRYLLPMLIPLCIFIAKGFECIGKFLPQRAGLKIAAVVLQGFFIAANLISLYSVFSFYHIN